MRKKLKLNFKLEGHDCTVDTLHGTFTCTDPTLQARILEMMEDCDPPQQYFGGYSSMQEITIDKPLFDITQFTAVIHMSDLTMPQELYPYAPCYAPLLDGEKPLNIYTATEEELEERSKIHKRMEELGCVF